MDESSLNTRIKSVSYMLGQMKPYRRQIFLSIIAGILKEACIISAVGICAYMAAEAIKGGSLSGRPWLWILAACVAGRCAATFFESYLSHDAAYHALVDYRVKLYDKFETLCPDILLKERSGQIATTLMNDVEILEWFYGHTVGFTVVVAAICTGITVFLGTLHWSLALAMLMCTVVMLCVPFLMKNKADKQGALIRDRLGEANAVTLEGINGMNEILTLNWQERYKKKNRHFMDLLNDAQAEYAKRMGTEGGLLQASAGLSAVIINLLSIWLTLNGKLQVEWFAVVGTTAWLAFNPLLELCGIARNFGLIFGASERISGILQAKPIVPDSGEKTDTENLRPDIRFNHVSVGYGENETNVINDVSFHIEAGEIVAIVGESGAGKTTCANLLARLWDVRDGSISIGSMDIRRMKLSDLHSMISAVLQDVYLFNTTIRDNIALGKLDASFEEIVSAAKIARIHEFILSLPDGYDTVAGERGVQISGGQRQRIAIARAVLKDSPILIMDEAVSNLDTKTEKEIQDTIRSLAHKKTIIMIAHRLSTILEADRIIVLHNGRVIQEGTHDALIAQGGYYKKLINAQLEEKSV
ncbi:MAG: ABC transporter ATP-binding protein [Clostridiales bacterium]|nr:ABC transporter ATP-binding protein [Clostridiales bacterium]